MSSLLKAVKSHMSSIIFIFIILVLAFSRITEIFFQQDEWFGLGNAFTYKALGLQSIFKASFLPDYALSRYVPITGLINYVIFNSFAKNSQLYGILGFSLIFINSILLYIFTFRISKSKLIAVMTPGLWVTNGLSVQSVTWIGTMLPSQFSILAFLIGINLYMLFIKKSIRKYLIWSVVFFSLSIFIKEQGIYYLVPLILFAKYRVPKFARSNLIKVVLICAIPIVLFIFVPKAINVFQSYPVNVSITSEPISSENILANTLLLPARSLAHIYLPPEQLYKLIYKTSQAHYPDIESGSVIETASGDVFSLMVSFYILLIVLMMTLTFTTKDKKIVLTIVFSFFASTVPFVLYQNSNAILEPRYYLHPALWGSFLITFTTIQFFSRYGHVGQTLGITLLGVILINNIESVRFSLDTDIVTGRYRKDILSQVDKIRNKLGEDNVFYFYTDNNGFYEFQSGFGQTLAVWFFDTGQIPLLALRDLDFWDPSFEGIKDYEERKYGYFMSYNKLIDGLNKNRDIQLEDVHSFYWNPSEHTVTDVSSKIRDQVVQDLNEKNIY